MLIKPMIHGQWWVLGEFGQLSFNLHTMENQTLYNNNSDNLYSCTEHSKHTNRLN